MNAQEIYNDKHEEVIKKLDRVSTLLSRHYFACTGDSNTQGYINDLERVGELLTRVEGSLS